MPLLLLAQETSRFNFDRLLNPEVLVFSIPIVAIIAVAGVKITNAITRHRERMEKLRQGMDPDDPRLE